MANALKPETVAALEALKEQPRVTPKGRRPIVAERLAPYGDLIAAAHAAGNSAKVIAETLKATAEIKASPDAILDFIRQRSGDGAKRKKKRRSTTGASGGLTGGANGGPGHAPSSRSTRPKIPPIAPVNIPANTAPQHEAQTGEIQRKF